MASTEENLKKLLETIAKEQNYPPSNITIKGYTSDGANFMTALYLATISEPLKPDLNLFAKVAILSEKFRERNEMHAKAYKIESAFYTQLAVYYERLYEKHNVPVKDRLMVPKLYGQDLTEMSETMVLENLEAKGYRNFDRMKTFDWEYAATAVQQMARFHALGIAMRVENPTEFSRIVSDIRTDMLGQDDSNKAFMELALKNGCSIASKEHAEKLQKYFASGVLAETLTSVMADKTMLIHGDYKPSNLMHRRKNGKLEIVPLDFQILRMGNPVADLMYFIFIGSDEKFRRLHYERLLDHYHKELTMALKHFQIDAEKVYSKKTFEQDLFEMRPLGLILGLTIVAMITVSPEDAPKIEDTLDEMALKPNLLAQERINGIIKDYIRWGVL